MQLNAFLYRNSIFFFLFFSGVAVWGFWPSYFSHPWRLPTALHHVHAWTMVAWFLMLLSQAYLIRTNRREVHRAVGQASYVVAPLIVVTALALVHYRFQALDDLSPDHYLLLFLSLGAPVLFALFFSLAIRYRRASAVHGRFMISTVFPVYPAASDRLLYNLFQPDSPFPSAVELAGWIAGDLILLSLAIWDWLSHRRINVFPIVLVLMVLYQVLAFVVPELPQWRSFARWFAE